MDHRAKRAQSACLHRDDTGAVAVGLYRRREGVGATFVARMAERASMPVSSGHDFRVGEPQRRRFDPEYKVCKVWRGGERETCGAP